MSSFVRRTAARLSSSGGGPAAAAGQRKGSDLHPIMEDQYGSGRETDGSRSTAGGLSTSATFTTDDDADARPRTTQALPAGEQFQMHDLKSVQHR